MPKAQEREGLSHEGKTLRPTLKSGMSWSWRCRPVF